MTRLSASSLAAVACAALLFSPATAAARDPKLIYRPASTSTALSEIDLLNALRTIRRVVAGTGTSKSPCGLNVARSHSLTARKLIIRCPDKGEHVFVFSQIVDVGVVKYPGDRYPDVFVNGRGGSLSLVLTETEQLAPRLADAFYLLAHKRLPRDPASDAEFLAAVATAKSSGDRIEDQRRTVVQADTLLEENRTEDALQLYAEALKTSPDWALGHYNLALIDASLELLPEAITRMKRYLYLAPDAEDARAAQDQIYAWEALLSQ